MDIKRVTDIDFKKYGRIVPLDTKEILNVAKNIKNPDDGTKYLASVEEFENLKIAEEIKNECFGGMETQIGYCWGKNNQMAAMEWHICSEVNIAIEDLILLLGDIRDIDENMHYNSSKIEAFRLNKGETVEIYATTLHYCPINVYEQGFGSVVGLLKGTNTEVDYKTDDKLVFGKNKWLICHKESEDLIKDGAFVGIDGENYKL